MMMMMMMMLGVGGGGWVCDALCGVLWRLLIKTVINHCNHGRRRRRRRRLLSCHASC